MKKIIMMFILLLLFVNQIYSESYSMILNGTYGTVNVSSNITELIINDASNIDELIINNDLKIKTLFQDFLKQSFLMSIISDAH